MRYIKQFEKYPTFNIQLDFQKKLLSHITKVFNELGYDYGGFFLGTTHETEFYVSIDGEKERAFTIKGDHSVSLIFLSVILGIGSLTDELGKFVPTYFKTINGLELYSEHKDFYNTTFKIVGDVDNIIEQITAEDIKLKFESNKYNL